jgi:hypothetical protein
MQSGYHKICYAMDTILMYLYLFEQSFPNFWPKYKVLNYELFYSGLKDPSVFVGTLVYFLCFDFYCYISWDGRLSCFQLFQNFKYI